MFVRSSLHFPKPLPRGRLYDSDTMAAMASSLASSLRKLPSAQDKPKTISHEAGHVNAPSREKAIAHVTSTRSTRAAAFFVSKQTCDAFDVSEACPDRLLYTTVPLLPHEVAEMREREQSGHVVVHDKLKVNVETETQHASRRRRLPQMGARSRLHMPLREQLGYEVARQHQSSRPRHRMVEHVERKDLILLEPSKNNEMKVVFDGNVPVPFAEFFEQCLSDRSTVQHLYSSRRNEFNLEQGNWRKESHHSG